MFLSQKPNKNETLGTPPPSLRKRTPSRLAVPHHAPQDPHLAVRGHLDASARNGAATRNEARRETWGWVEEGWLRWKT